MSVYVLPNLFYRLKQYLAAFEYRQGSETTFIANKLRPLSRIMATARMVTSITITCSVPKSHSECWSFTCILQISKNAKWKSWAYYKLLLSTLCCQIVYKPEPIKCVEGVFIALYLTVRDSTQPLSSLWILLDKSLLPVLDWCHLFLILFGYL